MLRFVCCVNVSFYMLWFSWVSVFCLFVVLCVVVYCVCCVFVLLCVFDLVACCCLCLCFVSALITCIVLFCNACNLF